MVFAWPEPRNARFAGKSAGARCGVQEAFASGGTEAPTNRPGEKSLAGSMQRCRLLLCLLLFLLRRSSRRAKRRGMKKAIVALARRLAVILHRLIEEPLDQISG